MSTIPEIPAYQADLESDHELIEKLYTIAKADEKRKQVVVKTYVVHNKPLSPLTSWNMRESVYKKKNPELPTKARGLFTVRDKNKYKVVVRGYDKFFNVGETSETEWPSLEKETEGPFEVTVKENGCIIFIAAISESEIVVTSKHSIPDPQDDPAAHAGVGYNWLLKHLSTAGRTLDELTKWLHAKSITLVAELCDDAFEEHVLAYEPKESGLYLHGINYNTGTLHTLPIETVRGVARYFGFHSIDYVKLDTLQQVRKLAEETKENGEFQGRLIEGIVVRCKRQNMDFFFKIKNDKYLLYREWREATKALIDVKDGAVKLKHGVQPRCQYEKTKYYVLWLRERLQDHPEWFKDYKHNKGIINVRRRFEEFYENGDLSSLKGDPDAAVKFTQKKF